MSKHTIYTHFRPLRSSIIRTFSLSRGCQSRLWHGKQHFHYSTAAWENPRDGTFCSDENTPKDLVVYGENFPISVVRSVVVLIDPKISRRLLCEFEFCSRFVNVAFDESSCTIFEAVDNFAMVFNWPSLIFVEMCVLDIWILCQYIIWNTITKYDLS